SRSSATAKYGCQSRLSRMGRRVAAQKSDQRILALTSQGKCTCSEVTCESGQGLAKSIGCHTPSLSSASQELKSQPKNELIVSVVSSSSASSSSDRKSWSGR